MNPTLQRLRRLLVMVPWLLEHPGVGLDEVARRFDVAPAEVVRDLDVLGYCGLPGYGGGDLVEAVVSGGQVTVRMADFFSRPLSLSVREGVALLLAARAARALGVLGATDEHPGDGEAGPGGPLATAIAKLESHLGAQAEIPVAVDVGASGQHLLGRLLPAVEEPRVVRLTYRSASKDETTVRDVEPWAVTAHEGAWYLQGHCRLAAAPRSFHLERILDLQVTGEQAPSPPAAPLDPPRYQPSADDLAVVIDVAPEVAWVADGVVLDDRQAAQGGWTRLSFHTATLDWAARLVLGLAGRARVVEPVQLRDLVAQRADAALARYGAD